MRREEQARGRGEHPPRACSCHHCPISPPSASHLSGAVVGMEVRAVLFFLTVTQLRIKSPFPYGSLSLEAKAGMYLDRLFQQQASSEPCSALVVAGVLGAEAQTNSKSKQGGAAAAAQPYLTAQDRAWLTELYKQSRKPT